jgi:hypothetical protein
LLNKTTPGATAAITSLAYTVPQLAQSFLTVVETRTLASTTVPQNFYCMQVDAYTGKVRVYRP